MELLWIHFACQHPESSTTFLFWFSQHNIHPSDIHILCEEFIIHATASQNNFIVIGVSDLEYYYFFDWEIVTYHRSLFGDTAERLKTCGCLFRNECIRTPQYFWGEVQMRVWRMKIKEILLNITYKLCTKHWITRSVLSSENVFPKKDLKHTTNKFKFISNETSLTFFKMNLK